MLTQDERATVVAELAARPGHEKVRALLHRLIVDGLGAESRDIDFERRVPKVHGRIDALLGRTVLEFKSDLRREHGTAEEELTRYLTDRQRATGQDYVGLATDGADFVAYISSSTELWAKPGATIPIRRPRGSCWSGCKAPLPSAQPCRPTRTPSCASSDATASPPAAHSPTSTRSGPTSAAPRKPG